MSYPGFLVPEQDALETEGWSPKLAGWLDTGQQNSWDWNPGDLVHCNYLDVSHLD